MADEETREQPIAPMPPAPPAGWPTPPAPASQAGWVPTQSAPGSPQAGGGTAPTSPPTGWGAPPSQPPQTYWSAPTYYPSSTLVVVAAILLLLAGLLVTVFGLIALFVGATFAELMRSVTQEIALGSPPGSTLGSIGELIKIVAVIVLVVGLVQVVAAIGMFAHKSWGRWLGAIVALPGLLLGGLGLYGALYVSSSATSDSGALWTAAAILLIYGLTLLSAIFGGSHYTRRYVG